MPDQYTNPDIKPCSGGYTWIPQTSPNIGGVNPLLGFDSLVINRGKFRNYSVDIDGSSSILVKSEIDYLGYVYSPIINATRPLALSDQSVKFSNNSNFVALANPKKETLISFTFPSSDQSRPLSCIELVYDLSFWDGDSPVSGEDVTSFPAIDVIGVDSNNNEQSYGQLNLSSLRTNQSVDGLDTSDQSAVFITQRIKLGTSETNRSDFPKIKTVYFKTLYQNSSLVFALKKIMFFTADRVNFRFDDDEKQLPCVALGYSMLISGTLYPLTSYVSTINVSGGTLGASGSTDSSGAFYWPQDNRLIGCNTHIKVFNPDYSTGSPGFAHSFNLHLIVVTFPTFGPLAAAFGFDQPWFGVVIGPYPFTQQLVFRGTAKVANNNYLANTLVSSQKPPDGSYTVSADNVDIGVVYQILALKSVLQKKQNISFESVANNSTSKTEYKNIFTDPFGIISESGVYSGYPARVTNYLQASDDVGAYISPKATFTYQSLILYDKINLAEVFKTDPCVIYKLNSSYGLTNSLLIRPGFISAMINCYKTDKLNIFDTQLVYRIYAVRSGNTNVDPNEAFAVANTLKINKTSGTTPPNIEFTKYNSSWTFDNVLVTGKISTEVELVTAEVLINSEINSFSISDVAFDLYVAIYSVSTLNDNIADINFTNIGIFDLPLINLVINNDFYLSLPIYYLKSYNNGGFIQPIHDFGYTGNYTSDTNTYTLSGQLYNGTTFDNSKAYVGAVSSQGFGDLLTLVSSQGGGEGFFVEVPTGSQNNPSSLDIDFFVVTDQLDNGLINLGDWNFTIDFDSLGGVEYKIVIDLLDIKNNKFILKVLSTPYITDINPTYTIKIPFSLSNFSTGLIFRIIFKNSGDATTINISNIQINSNTIGFFNYSGTKPPVSADIGFYEDLTLQPSSFVGNCNQFAMYLDLPSDGYVIFNAPDGVPINGALYSPTWTVTLPEDMEVSYKTTINPEGSTITSGITPYDVFFRTGAATNVKSLDTKQSGTSTLVVTVANSSEDNSIKQISSESYLRMSTYNGKVYSNTTNNNLEPLQLQNPVLSQTNQLSLVGQSNSDTNVSSINYNVSDTYNYVQQHAPPGLMVPEGQEIERLKGCFFVATDSSDDLSFYIGVTPHGNLLFSQSSINEFDNDFPITLIQGDLADSELRGLGVQNTLPNIKGKAGVYYPGIIHTGGSTIVFFTFSSGNDVIQNNAIYAADITKGFNPILVFNFNNYVSNAPGINSITVAKQQIDDTMMHFHLAFDCGNKLFEIQINYGNGVFFVFLMGVLYGNLNDGGFGSQIAALVARGTFQKLLIQSKSGEQYLYNKDFDSSQRVGFLDFNGGFYGVQFYDGTDIKEIIFHKSYTCVATLRIIGTV